MRSKPTKEKLPLFLGIKALGVITKVSEIVLDKVLTCKFCGNKLKRLPYGFTCENCGYVILADDVRDWLDKLFDGEVVEREELLYEKAFKSGYEAGYDEGFKK